MVVQSIRDQAQYSILRVFSSPQTLVFLLEVSPMESDQQKRNHRQRDYCLINVFSRNFIYILLELLSCQPRLVFLAAKHDGFDMCKHTVALLSPSVLLHSGGGYRLACKSGGLSSTRLYSDSLVER